MVRITVCRSCAADHPKIKKALRRLRKEHGDGIEVASKSCLDACKREPVVRVGKTLLAPAKRKKLRRAVEERLASDAPTQM